MHFPSPISIFEKLGNWGVSLSKYRFFNCIRRTKMMNQTSKCIKSHCGIIKLKFFRRWELFKSFLGLALYSIISSFFMSQQTSNDVKIDIFDKIPKSFYAYQDILSEPFNAFSSTKSS